MNSDLKNNRAMSQTFTNLPGGRVYKLDRVIDKIKDSQRKQIKVLAAQLEKKNRNQVTMAMTQFKMKKADLFVKEKIKERVEEQKWRNEKKSEKVASRKALLEHEKEKKRLELYEKEKREMSPIHF